ncbi:MAG: SCO6745 family protein [Acidimicrobiales bacterium]
MIDDADVSDRARTLASLLEPVVAQVYFSPECHQSYVELGFRPSVAKAGEVALPDGSAYFTSRGSVMGQVAAEVVVAAAFAVYDPDVVVRSVTLGWRCTDAATICDARDRGVIAQLTRILDPRPHGAGRAAELLRRVVGPLRLEGRPLYAGVRSLGIPDDPLAAVWRCGDMLREFRGDSRTAAWHAAGLDAPEICLLSELHLGSPARSHSRSRGWSHDRLDTAAATLEARGWITHAGITYEGRAAREAIEIATDRQMRTAIDALGDDLDELAAILAPWGAAIIAGAGYVRFRELPSSQAPT